jgi:hypothetical protein
MVSRRELLQAGFATIPLVALPSSAFAIEPSAVPLYKVIFDERFAAGVAFAAEGRRLGAAMHAIRDNITPVWYGDLYHQWRRSPVAIAGLTTNHSLFWLDTYAREVRMRVVYHADHRFRTDGTGQHQVFGAESARQTAMLNEAGANWCAEAAKLVMRFPETACRPIGKIADLTACGIAPEALVSWVIAPVKRT